MGTVPSDANAIENVNKLLAIYTDRVCYWKNSEQRQRWVATALLETEPRLRKIRGYEHLPQLRSAMAQLIGKRKTGLDMKAAA